MAGNSRNSWTNTVDTLQTLPCADAAYCTMELDEIKAHPLHYIAAQRHVRVAPRSPVFFHHLLPSWIPRAIRHSLRPQYCAIELSVGYKLPADGKTALRKACTILEKTPTSLVLHIKQSTVTVHTVSPARQSKSCHR